MLAFVYDRVNTRFGKLRVLLISGYLIEAVGLLCMFNLCSSKGLGLPVFALTYIIYIIGYTVTNMTAQTLPAIMTNDPRQRPTIGVWTTALNYAVPMGMSMLIYTVILPKCGGTFNQDFLSMVCTIVLIIAGIGTPIVCAGISAYDKPESFEGTNKKHEPLKIADVLEVLKHNKPLQCYIASNASDKLAQQVGSQAIINTMLNGILIGNMGLATTLGVISMVPSIFFAAFGAKYVGKKGQQEGHRDLDLHQHGHHRCADPVLHLHGYPSDRRDGQLEHDRLRPADPAAERFQHVHHHLQHFLHG